MTILNLLERINSSWNSGELKKALLDALLIKACCVGSGMACLLGTYATQARQGQQQQYLFERSIYHPEETGIPWELYSNEAVLYGTAAIIGAIGAVGIAQMISEYAPKARRDQ